MTEKLSWIFRLFSLSALLVVFVDLTIMIENGNHGRTEAAAWNLIAALVMLFVAMLANHFANKGE